MKKFLFTLAALFMAGSAFATNDYFAMDDLTLTQDQLGTEVAMPVTAHFEGMVSAFDLEFICPDGVTVTGHQFKPGRKIDCYMYSEDDDDIVMTSFTPSIRREGAKLIGITSILEQEYDYINGELVECMAVKWKPGDHYMLDVKMTFAEGFQGGDIIVKTRPTCGQDPREAAGIYPRSTGETYEYTVHVTVDGGTPEPEKTPNPVITVTPDEDEMGATVAATGMGEVLLYADGVLVENPYHVARVEGQDVTIVFTATAQGENMLISDVEEYELTLDALPVTPPTPGDLTGEIVIGDPDENGNVTIDYTGNEDVTIVVTVNGEEVEVVDGVITVGEGENEIVVTVTADNYNTLTATKVVNYTAPVTPEDPHMQGYWLVVIDMFGNHNWFPLTKGANNDYVTTVSLEYYTYGLYDPDPENAAQVPFYFVVDGVQYGAEEPMTVAAIGQAMENPLSESEEYYTVPVGYSYALGIAIIENEYYAYVSQAYPTSVDELNAGKTVAGVRYFNMAGQEMQEANGMTIVVTTYTDGTTSAVKVMK